MRIVAVLSWWNEPADWLTECVSSARFCDYLIAVDGPYSAFPGAADRPTSPKGQGDAILRAGLPGEIHTRKTPWTSEVEKRNHTFALAKAAEADWIFVIDADEYVQFVPDGLRDVLVESDCGIAECTLMYEAVPGWPLQPSTVRRLYKVTPDIGYSGTHYRVISDGVDLSDQSTPAQPTGLQMVHRSHERSVERKAEKDDYYKLLPLLEGTMARFEVVIRPLGLVDGRDWPEVGETVDLPASVGRSMADAGWLKEVVEKRPAPKREEKR